MNDVAIIGVGLHPFGRFDKTAMEMGADAIQHVAEVAEGVQLHRPARRSEAEEDRSGPPAALAPGDIRVRGRAAWVSIAVSRPGTRRSVP